MPYHVPADKYALIRERPWVVAGGAALSAVAGYVNVVLLGFFHVPVSHMSGAVSRLSIDIAGRNFADLRTILWIVGGFLLGAVVSGAVIGGEQLVPGRRYGVVLFLEGILLGFSTALLLRDDKAGVAMAAVACGLQNAMASAYHGLVMRTTHVTGIVTDIGILLGHLARHKRIELWKFRVLLAVLAGFFAGGAAGAAAFQRMGVGALWLAAGFCVAAGNVYYVWKQLHRSWLADPADRNFAGLLKLIKKPFK